MDDVSKPAQARCFDALCIAELEIMLSHADRASWCLASLTTSLS